MLLSNRIQELYSKELLDLLLKIGEIAKRLGLKAYAVGGFVRDLLLERPNFDIDIMVEGDAIPFATEAAKEFGVECKLIERFHTAHIYFPNLTIDFSSARKEVYSKPGALPTVTLSNLRDDLYRRDFTINAMAMSISPDSPFELVDYFKGVEDLRKKEIRILHPKSFIDDPTRLYRALRFADRFKFELEFETEYSFENAVARNAPNTLSPKRIASEIDKCFQEKHPLTLLSKYQREGLLKYYHKDFSMFKQPNLSIGVVRPLVTRLQGRYKQVSESALYWALLLSALPLSQAQPLLYASGLPHSIVTLVMGAIKAYDEIPVRLLEAEGRVAIYNSLKGLSPEAIGLLLIGTKNKDIESKINEYLNSLCKIKAELSGKDLIELGILPGEQIGIILDKIVEEKLKGNEMTRKDEIDFVRRISHI